MSAVVLIASADSQFCSPNDTSCFPGTLSNAGTVYQHTFNTPGSYSYICIAHCVIGMAGVVNVTGSCGQSGWSAGPDMPTPLVRAVGVYFQTNGNFYTMGGRTSDNPGSDFQHALQYSPGSNSWTQRGVTLPDNQMNNMACGVLTVSGTPSIYCVGGSAAGQTTATGRVFSYNPVTDTAATLTGDDWPGAMGTILPGGFAVANNKLYILGGFNINVASTNQIWEFNPAAAVGAKWTQKTNTPVGIMYAPTCTIDGIIYVGGATDYQGGTVVDTTTSFSFNPVANSIGTIAAIPRATGETRGLNFNGRLYVMGGGRVAPNPSNEVDIYDPGTNSWSTAPSFNNARRNFPTDTDGTTHIWLSGGYDVDGITPLSSMEIFCQGGGTPTPTPTATATATATATSNCDGNSHRHIISNGDGHCHRVSIGDCHRHGISIPNGDTTTRSPRHANTAPSAHARASSITAVAASLRAKLEGGCEVQRTTVGAVAASHRDAATAAFRFMAQQGLCCDMRKVEIPSAPRIKKSRERLCVRSFLQQAVYEGDVIQEVNKQSRENAFCRSLIRRLRRWHMRCNNSRW